MHDISISQVIKGWQVSQGVDYKI